MENQEKLNKQTIKEIKQARENIKKGKYYTEEQARQILNRANQ